MLSGGVLLPLRRHMVRVRLDTWSNLTSVVVKILSTEGPFLASCQLRSLTELNLSTYRNLLRTDLPFQLQLSYRLCINGNVSIWLSLLLVVIKVPFVLTCLFISLS